MLKPGETEEDQQQRWADHKVAGQQYVEEWGEPQKNPRYRDQNAVRAREAEAIRLRNQRLTYREIAARLGYKSAQSARELIMACYDREISKNVAEIRHHELSGLDQLEAAAWTKAMEGDEKAIETVLKIKAARRKYIGGLEVPIKTEVEVSAVSDSEWNEALRDYYINVYLPSRKAAEQFDDEVKSLPELAQGHGDIIDVDPETDEVTDA